MRVYYRHRFCQDVWYRWHYDYKKVLWILERYSQSKKKWIFDSADMSLSELLMDIGGFNSKDYRCPYYDDI